VKDLFLGRPLHWLLWAIILGGLALLGALRLHTRDFNLFALIVLALAAFGVLVVVATYRKGERITRDPFEDD
jgi:asparagine N-glycosylation enzyme membrane subunit Stt3